MLPVINIEFLNSVLSTKRIINCTWTVQNRDNFKKKNIYIIKHNFNRHVIELILINDNTHFIGVL